MKILFLYTSIAGFAALFCSFSNTLFAQTSPADRFLTSFKADLFNNATVQLNWTVQSDKDDSLDFTIERSRDGILFQPLSKLAALIRQAQSGFYFTDNFPLTDTSFYRIAWQEKASGNKVYSAVQKVYFPVKAKTEINIMPNPVFNNACLIIIHEELGDISCTLLDLTGKNIRTYQVKKTVVYMQYILDMYSVPKGEYILNIRGNAINESKRILKQ